MGFGDFKDKAQEMGKQHSDKVDQGMDKAGDAAKEKFGNEDKVDQATEKGKSFFGADEEQEQEPEQ